MKYRALKLYPKIFDSRENIYVGASVRKRLDGLKAELKARHYYPRYVEEAMDHSLRETFSVLKGETPPYLREYLRLAQDLGWNISRDVNYAYAEVLYPPIEIERRLRRLFPITKTLGGACFLLKCEIGYDTEYIKATVKYGYDRLSVCYGKMMHYMMREERRHGYSDALDFEE